MICEMQLQTTIGQLTGSLKCRNLIIFNIRYKYIKKFYFRASFAIQSETRICLARARLAGPPSIEADLSQGAC